VTHDELLARITEGKNDYEYLLRKALRAIVELHKPRTYSEYAKFFNPGHVAVMSEDCEICDLRYPCPTIQAIEKELG
jgi:hypothetical protein